VILTSLEKSTGVANRTLMDLFNCFIADMNLIEIHRIGPKFTWTNKQEVPIMEVLDRVLVSPSWEQMYRGAALITLHCWCCVLPGSHPVQRILRRNPLGFSILASNPKLGVIGQLGEGVGCWITGITNKLRLGVS
jgi:hypothetical protein